MNICKTILIYKFGKKNCDKINIINGDFLDKNIKLPKNCKVISNPPYAKILQYSLDWLQTDIINSTKELYAAFMEKIIKQSEKSVIITPYSFIGGTKYYNLRQLMNNYNGFITSFDNVPGNIFCGKKHGIFNSNISNSVRAAITVVKNDKEKIGFKLSPLIRFKNNERNKLLKSSVLEGFLNNEYQCVNAENSMYFKCDSRLYQIFKIWKLRSNSILKDYVNNEGKYSLSVPNTCRYFTIASNGKLNRSGQITLSFDSKEIYEYVFCLINSSFAYWYWRIFDGGITYTKSLLLSLPMFFNILSEDDKSFFSVYVTNMIDDANKYIVQKNNVGIQESIKYPRYYRDRLNKRFLNILHLNFDESIFDIIHANFALENTND